MQAKLILLLNGRKFEEMDFELPDKEFYSADQKERFRMNCDAREQAVIDKIKDMREMYIRQIIASGPDSDRYEVQAASVMKIKEYETA